MKSKAQIRSEKTEQRLRLSTAQVERMSKMVLEHLVGYMDWNNTNSVHIYQTILRLKEVDTMPLIDFLKDKHSNINIYFPETKPLNLDVIIAPLLAFDKKGFRLGHGGGYYDRFLKKYPDARKIGLSYEFQRVNIIPTEPHDVGLDAVITEEKIYQFR